MDCHQLTDFRATRNDYSGDLLLLVSGARAYKGILSRAFPGLYFSRTFEDRYDRFDWGTYVKGAGEAECTEIETFCALLQDALFIVDDLDESYALGLHTRTSVHGGYERTEIGGLVRQAKPYDRVWNAGNRKKATELAEKIADLIKRHPTCSRADVLVPVPPSNRNKDFDLPTYLVEVVSERTNIATGADWVEKVRETRPMKECTSIQEKIDNIKDAFEADRSKVEGRSVVIVDDIYQSGFSINEVGRALQNAGVRLVLGITATKTKQDV